MIRLPDSRIDPVDRLLCGTRPNRGPEPDRGRGPIRLSPFLPLSSPPPTSTTSFRPFFSISSLSPIFLFLLSFSPFFFLSSLLPSFSLSFPFVLCLFSLLFSFLFFSSLFLSSFFFF